MMTRFAPINDDHAIEQVVFSVAFARPFSADELASFRRNHDRWAEELPAIREPVGFAVAVETEKTLKVEPAPGVEFAIVRPDGSAVWALRIVGAEIIVECSRYSRWARVWKAAREYLERAFDLVATFDPPSAMVRAALAVQDAFVAPTEGYELAGLLKETALLPSAIFERGLNWHTHTGWFSELEGDRVLQNVNIDGVGEGAGNASMARVAILHVQIAAREGPDSAEPAQRRVEWLDRLMDGMHQQNKILMEQLLATEIIARIGLKAAP
jgi:uncharacterized protein (TIGR04255 family)